MGLDTIQLWENEKEDVMTQVAEELSKPERDILETLSPFNFLTAEQLTRLLYSPASHAYVQHHLRSLVQKRFLTDVQANPPREPGWPPPDYRTVLCSDDS
jgi:hypothetical protein